MEPGYTSSLSKETLAYNLSYHLKDRCGIENAHEVVISILNAFEYKEPEPKEDSK